MNHKQKSEKYKKTKATLEHRTFFKIKTLKIQSKQPIRGLLTHIKALNQLNGRLYI